MAAMRIGGLVPASLGLSLGLVGACGAVTVGEDEATRGPAEFGRVAWGRRLEPALELAEQTQRPVLLLFQEVPG